MRALSIGILAGVVIGLVLREVSTEMFRLFSLQVRRMVHQELREFSA